MADVLKAQELVSLKLYKNGVLIHQSPYEPAEESFTEKSADRVILATNMTSPQEYNMGGVATAARLYVESDQQILVAIDTTTTKWTVGKDQEGGVLLLRGTSFTHLYLQNENTTNTATIDVVVTD